MVIDHPVVAAGAGASDLFTQVIYLLLSDGSTAGKMFDVAVNKPGESAVTARRSSVGFGSATKSRSWVVSPTQLVILAAGEHRVVQ